MSAGAWTSLLMDDMPVPLRTTQEQPAHFPALDPGIEWPSFLHHSGAGLSGDVGSDFAVYGLASVDGIKVGLHARGPIVDPDHRDRTPDPVALAALQKYARTWLPGVAVEAAAHTTCLYTLTPDHHFIVDRVGPVVVLAGFSGHGFKFAPAIGELAAALESTTSPRRRSSLLAAAFPARTTLGSRPIVVRLTRVWKKLS